MKKRNAGLRAALLLLSLIFLLSQLTPKEGAAGFSFFSHLPAISTPVCIILAIAAYIFYYLIDIPDREQH